MKNSREALAFKNDKERDLHPELLQSENFKILFNENFLLTKDE